MPEKMFFKAPQENQKNTKATPDDFFEKNFSPFKINGVEMIDIKQEKESRKPPVLFVPGWLGAIEDPEIKEVIHEIYKSNREVLSLNRRGTKGEIKKTEKTLLLPKEIRRQATAIYEVLMYKIGKATKKEISLITHSIGGPNALVAILMVKEEMPTAKINVTIINSAGTIGKDSVFKLAGRFAEKMRNKQNQKTLSSATKKIAYLKNPLQANNELIGMTGFQIDALMRELRKMGVGISVIHSENDRMLPADRVKENLNSEHADEIHFMEGTHNQLYHDPEKYVAKAEEMLSTLEASQGGNFNIKV